MAFDGLVVRAVVHELQACVGGRFHKIHQPNEHELVCSVRAQGKTRKLLLSANPTYPRFHWTERSYINPLEAPMFCMLLRKHCEGGVIESIKQIGMERVVHIDVRQRDELGDVNVKRIILEIMGRHSNIILLDPATGTVMDAIHRITPAISSYRTVLPGNSYVEPPEQSKRNPLETSVEAVLGLLNADGEEAGDLQPAAERWTHRFVQSFSGLSPLAARAIAASAEREDDASSVARRFVQAMDQIERHQYEPNILQPRNGRGKSLFSVVPLASLGGDITSFATITECLEAYYGDKAERDAVKQKTSDLTRFLQNEKAKNENKLKKLQGTLDEAQDADRYRIYGELLNAYMHTVKKGMERVELVNYYDEEQRPADIALDPLLSPSDNAQRYFKKYQKMRNSLVAVEEQMRQAEEEIRYLDSLLQQFEGAGLSDIEEIRAELVQGGYVRERAKKGAKRPKKNDKPHIHGFLSSEGVPIYVGKNNLQNEYVTNRLAHASDTWLHTKDIPGSHVVIRSESFGTQTLEEAANLAAYFSKAKSSSGVPVDYTLIRHVRKPSGAKPGFVIYEKQRTLFITPDEEKVKRMTVLDDGHK